MAVFVVLVGHAVVPANITVERLRGLHAVLYLLLGQAVEGEALTVGELGHETVGGENVGVLVHGSLLWIWVHYNTLACRSLWVILRWSGI